MSSIQYPSGMKHSVYSLIMGKLSLFLQNIQLYPGPGRPSWVNNILFCEQNALFCDLSTVLDM